MRGYTSQKFRKDIFSFMFKSPRSVSKISLHNGSDLARKRAKQERKFLMTPSIKRGDIFYADLSPVVGSEQGGLRPVLIIQNDVGNRYSPTVIAAAITSRMGKTRLPTHIDIHADRVGLSKDSIILLEQIRTLDKRRLKEKMGHLDGSVMSLVNNALAVSFGLDENADGQDAGASPAIAPAAAVASTATVADNNDRGLIG